MTRRIRSLLCSAALGAAVLSGCGGGGGGGGGGSAPTPPPPAPPPPAGNTAPTASIAGATSAVAGAALLLDASASSDADGDALTFTWDFGDGTRGGAAKVAHLYTAAGSYTVTLTVTDARGAVTTAQRGITVNAGAPAASAVNTLAVITDTSGAPLAGVTVSVAGGASAITGADGRATVATARGVPVTLQLRKAGYAEQVQLVELPVDAESGYLEAKMLARETPLSLADAAAGGTLAGKHGARVTLPPNALVTAGGAPVTGAVQVAVTPVDVGANVAAFPGKFEGVRDNGERGLILSYGTVEYALTQGGAPLQLAAGRTATIEIPVYTTLNRDGSEVRAGDVYPLWSLDERTGIWIQEGTGVVVASSASPSGFALRGEVGHFSWWNHDIFDVPPYRPKPECLVDTDHDGILENLTDTGYCWHYGTGPDQPNQNTQPAPSGAARSAAAVRAATVNPGTRRIPAYAATASTPVGGGVELPIPANLDITFVTTARNGTLRGTRVLRGASGASEPVTIVLYPVGAASQNEAITLPWDRSYAMNVAGERDGFNFTAPANEQVEVRVTRALGSTLTGTYVVRAPGGAVVADGTLDANGAPVTFSTTVAGAYRIELTATAGAPGGYRLEVRNLSCTSSAPLSLPAEQVVNIAGRGIACFDVALPAATALRFEVPGFSAGLTGRISLLNANGELLGSDDFGGTFNAGDFQIGVRQAGTYRLRVTSEQPNAGSFTVRAGTVTSEPMSVSQSTTWTDITNGGSRRVLLTPPPDGLFSATLAVSNGQYGIAFYPSAAAVTAGCSGCTSVSTAALANRVHADVLPVLEVFRNTGSGAATSAVLTIGVPQPLPLDTHVTGTIGDAPQVYWFDGTAGTLLSGRLLTPAAQATSAGMTVLAPNGAAHSMLPHTTTLAALPATGVYSVVAARIGTSGTGSYTLRVNHVAPIQPLALAAPLTEIATSLALGEVRRYAVTLAQADVLGLSLTTPGGLMATAIVDGTDAIVQTSLGNTFPRVDWTGTRYVPAAGTYTLRLYSTASSLEAGAGAVTIGLRKPVPVPLALDTPATLPLALRTFEAFRVTVPATGRHVLRIAAGNSCCIARAWLPAPSNGSGLGIGVVSTGEAVGLLPAGEITVTAEYTNVGPNAAENVTLSLVGLEAPAPLAAGGAAASGQIDTPGERDHFEFTATAGQSFTLNVNANFAGSVRVHKLNPNGDFTSEALPLLSPMAFAAGASNVAFTVTAGAPFGAGTYLVQVRGDGDATGSYTVTLMSP